MNKKDLNNCFDMITPTEMQKKKMLLEINNYKGSVSMKKTTKRFSVIAIAATFCIVTATVVFATTTLNLNDRFLEIFKPSSKQIEQLTTAVENPQAKATSNGVTVEIKQTVGDKNGIYILYDVEIPENITFKEEYTFKNESFSVGTDDDFRNYSYDGRILEESAHKRTYLSYIQSDKSLQGEKIKMNIENIGYLIEGEPDTEWEFANIIEGTWNLEWIVNNSTEAKEINPDQEITVDNKKAVIKNIIITPFSLKIDLINNDSIENIHFIITHKDGTKVDSMGEEYLGGLSNSWADGTQTIQAYFYGKMIDINNIKNIEINGVILDIE